MRQTRPQIDATPDQVLGHLRRSCVAQIATVGQERATVTIRATTLLDLLERAKYGRASLTMRAKPFAELSKAGKHAANCRWEQARLRKHAESQRNGSTKSGAE